MIRTRYLVATLLCVLLGPRAYADARTAALTALAAGRAPAEYVEVTLTQSGDVEQRLAIWQSSARERDEMLYCFQAPARKQGEAFFTEVRSYSTVVQQYHPNATAPKWRRVALSASDSISGTAVTYEILRALSAKYYEGDGISFTDMPGGTSVTFPTGRTINIFIRPDGAVSRMEFLDDYGTSSTLTYTDIRLRQSGWYADTMTVRRGSKETTLRITHRETFSGSLHNEWQQLCK